MDTNRDRRGAFAAHLRLAAWYAALAVAVLVFAWPVLIQPRFGILDCPVTYDACQRFDWSRPWKLVDVLGFGNQARPFQFLMFVPAYFTTSAALHAWFENGFILWLTLACAFTILRKATGRAWLAFIGVILCFGRLPFTENFYTLTLCDVYMLCGAMLVLMVLQRMLEGRAFSRWTRWLWLFGGALGALYATGVKETAGAFFVSYCAALGVLSWGYGMPMRTVLRKTWWLSLWVVIGTAVLVAKFLSLDTLYTAGGAAGYTLAPAALLGNAQRFAAYFLDTASYVIPAMLLLLAGVNVLVVETLDETVRAVLRRKIAWAAVLFVVALCAAGILLPWQTFYTRYLLITSAGLLLGTVLCADIGITLLRLRLSVVAHTLLIDVAALAGILVLAHFAYGIMVGPLSEGRVRHQADLAYDDMFRYIAANAPSNGTVYYMMDNDVLEPMSNTTYALRAFYGRPDIQCVFPSMPDDYTEPGLVAVSEIRGMRFNYTRMPVHHASIVQFHEWFRNSRNIAHKQAWVYETPVWFCHEAYNVPQYTSSFGFPDFWHLKRGMYVFGWHVYEYKGGGQQPATVIARQQPAQETPPSPPPPPPPATPPPPPAPAATNLLRNGRFAQGTAGWTYWSQTKQFTNAVTTVAYPGRVATTALRLENPGGALIGMQQLVNVRSGQVYRLGARVRSTVTTDSKMPFGARVAVYAPGQPEYAVVWFSQATNWWRQEVAFTNAYTGTATVYAHLGYGKTATTGEFTDVRLEPAR